MFKLTTAYTLDPKIVHPVKLILKIIQGYTRFKHQIDVLFIILTIKIRVLLILYFVVFNTFFNFWTRLFQLGSV